MGRALILFESLAAALLLVALVAAWSSRSRSRLIRWGLPLLAVLLVGTPTGVLVYGMSFLNSLGAVSTVSYLAAIAWAGVFLIGALVIVASGTRAGAAWSVRPLAVSFAAASVLTAITVSNLDVAVKARLASVRVEAGAKAHSLLPPRSSDDRNAALIYRRAFAMLTPPNQLPDLLRERATTWQSYDRTAFDPAHTEQQEFLKSQERGLALLRQAAAMPECSFERDWSAETSPVDVLLPELPYLRHGAVLLAYDALARASRGDTRGAADDLSAIFGIARHIRYPLLIDLLTATRIEQTGVQALEDVLAVAPPNPQELIRILPAREPFRDHLQRTLAMEEAWGMAAITLFATGEGRDSADLQSLTRMGEFGASLLDTSLYRIFFLEEDLAAYRQHLRTMRENARKSAPESLDAYEAHERQIKATRGGGILSGLLVPAAYRVQFAALDGDAARALAATALAVVAYKAKHGKYPGTPGVLVPEFLPDVPVDPYDGRPVRMKQTDDGLILYSIGRDRTDDGGRRVDRDTGDLVFKMR